MYRVSHAKDASMAYNLWILSGASLGMLALLVWHKIWKNIRKGWGTFSNHIRFEVADIQDQVLA